MKYSIKFSLVMFVALAFCPLPVLAHTCDSPQVTELIANGGSPATAVDVGQVEVCNDGDYLYVKYIIDADLTPGDTSDDGVPTLITYTHLHVATDPEEIPQKKGNPIPGKFDYKTMHDPGVMDHTYQIPLDWDPNTDVYVAAHAVVSKEGGLNGLETALPDQVTMSVQYPYSGGPAYFPVTTISGGTLLDGTYEGWCIDTDNVIYQNTDYTANVYSSYEDLTGLVEFPENMDLVNWIINQDFVGQSSPGCGEYYTYGDIQRAIWSLLEDNNSTSGLGPWSQCRVDEILAAALANGEGFVPGCNDLVAVVLAPVNTNQVIIAQVTLIDVMVPCYPIDETAWGEGDDFPGKNWAMYFTYTIQATPCVEPDGSLSVTGTGWIADYAWCPCDYTYDLTATGQPVALQGFIDTSEAAVANIDDWSKYYAKFIISDGDGSAVAVVFGNDWLGPWYEMDAQQWDRIRMENNMGLPQPQQHYATVGGVLGYLMDGTWVGPGDGATIYPSDQNYFIQLIADPVADTLTLQVYGMGSSAPANLPDLWPKQNMYNEHRWLEIGTISLAENFDFSQVHLCAELWASTQAGASETSTINYNGIGFGAPLSFSDTPAP
jgi:hypothetical protein